MITMISYGRVSWIKIAASDSKLSAILDLFLKSRRIDVNTTVSRNKLMSDSNPIVFHLWIHSQMKSLGLLISAPYVRENRISTT